MGGVVRRAVVVAGVFGMLLGSGAGVASASQVLGWSPSTSAHAYSYRTLNPGETASQVFTLTNTGGPAPAAVTVTLAGPAAFTMTADSCSGTRLGTGASCTVTVQYSPAGYGEIDTASLTAVRNKAVTRTTLHGKATKAATGITTTPSAGGPVGSTVTDTATLSRGSSPTGTLTFSLYGPSTAADCSGTAVDTEQVTVSGDGSYTTPTGATPAQAGTYWWTAAYSGDTQNKSAAAGCGSEPVTVVPASPGITTSQQPATATVGSAVADQATVTGGFSPTGTVTFTLYGNASCAGSPLFSDTENLAGGTATSASYTTTAPATDYWVAAYNGDAGNNPVTAGCGSEPVSVVPASPGITTSQQPATATVGSAVADQATVTGGFSPTGTVTFTLYGNASCAGSPLFSDTENLAGGTATSASYTTTAPATDYWVAAYNGDAGNNPVTAGCGSEPVSVVPASPGITTSQQPATATVGSAVADQATVTGGFSPTGTVTFTLYGNASCAGSPLFSDTENLAGGTATSASYTTTAPATDYWVAAYNGDAGNNPVTAGCASEPVSVVPASPGITTSASAGGPPGTTVTDTATLSGGDTPTGTITFRLYGPSATASCSATAVDAEQVTVSGDGGYTTPAGATPALSGTYWWTASYSGDTQNKPAATSCGSEQVTISSNTVTVTNPGNQSGTVGTAVNLQIHATDSQSGQTLTYSATGLPAGLSINPSTGLISGTPTTAQTASVTVTATDTSGAHGSASFTWAISPLGGGCTPAQLLGNPGFETGSAAPWTTGPGVINPNGAGQTAHSGTWYAWLDGYGTTHTDTLQQTVTIPAACHNSAFTFWLHIDTAETTTTVAFDKLTITANGTTIATFSNLDHNTGYTQHSFSLAAFTGSVTLEFTGTEDSSQQTSFVVDDTAINTG